MDNTSVFIHPEAVVETDRIGTGTRIWRNAHVMPEVSIGKNCNIGENCFIEQNVTIGSGVTIKNNVALWSNIILEDDVFVGPAAVFTNDLRPRAFNKKEKDALIHTLIKRGATVGANATIVCGITVHEYAFIGAGSVVTREVKPNHMVFGNPARFHSLICRCSESIPAGKNEYTCSCGLQYIVRDNEIVDVILSE